MSPNIFAFNIEETRNRSVICFPCIMFFDIKNKAVMNVEINHQGKISLCQAHFEQYSVEDVYAILSNQVDF